MSKIREISVFVDESGSLDPDRESSQYYLVCMVFHDQDVDLSNEVAALNDPLSDMGFDSDHCIHAGPLIRREKEYAALNRSTRRGVLDRMMAFLRKTPISYKCFSVNKRFLGGKQSLHDSLLQQMVRFLVENASSFDAFDAIKVYYDNGQSGLTTVLKEAFALFASRTVFVPEVEPSRYRLFQVADVACTIELARLKLENDDGLSESENTFFGGAKNFKKNYLKILARKLFVK